MPSQVDIECFRNLPRHIASLCADLVGTSKQDVSKGPRRDGLRLLINGDEWLDYILKDPVFENCVSYYILLDEQIRKVVEHLRSHGFSLAVFFINTGLDWIHKHFKCDEFVVERDFRDTPLGQTLSSKILPILGINQMYNTLVELDVPVHGGRFRRNRELVESLQFNAANNVFLTSVKDDIWLRSGVSVVHFEDAMSPNGLCRIWSSVILQNLLNLNRTQFIEMLCVFSVLNNPSFHKGCLNIPSQGAMKFLSDISLHNIRAFANWLSYQDFGFRFSSPIFEINEALVSCRVYYSMKPGPNIAELMDRLLVPEKGGDYRAGRGEEIRIEGGRDPSGKWHFPVPGYGYVLPMYPDLFPKLEHKLKEHAIRSKGNGRAIPVIALRYLRRNTDDCAACIEQENMSSLEDGLRISHRSYPKIRQDVVGHVWGDSELLEAPLIPICTPEMPSVDTPISGADILAFNRFQIVCEALWLQCPHAFVNSPANTPAFYANDGLYRSQLLRIRKVDRFNNSENKVSLNDDTIVIARIADGPENGNELSNERLKLLPSTDFKPVEWQIPKYSELDDESNAEENLSVSTISPRGSPRGIERSSYRAYNPNDSEWVSIAQEGGQSMLKKLTKRATDFKTFEAISSMQSQGIAFDARANAPPPGPLDSKFFPSSGRPSSTGQASLEFPIPSPARTVGSGGVLSPVSQMTNISPQKGDDMAAPYSNLLDGDLSMSLFSGSRSGDMLGNGNSALFGQLPESINKSTDNLHELGFVPGTIKDKGGAVSMYDALSAEGPTLLDTLSVLRVSSFGEERASKPNIVESVLPLPPSVSSGPPGFSDPPTDSSFFGNSTLKQNGSSIAKMEAAWGSSKGGVTVPMLQFASLSGQDSGVPDTSSQGRNAPPGFVKSVPFSSNVKVQDSFAAYKDAILAHIAHNPISIIRGSPGCGKSLGIPSMLYENAVESNETISLVMSEHDPFVAMSIKAGLEKTFGDAVGVLAPGNEGRTGGGKSKLWLATTVFLVRYLARNPDVLKQYTHIILDDINERSVESDILCLLIKSFACTVPGLRVVLVSATPNVDLYTEYFNTSDECVLSVTAQACSVDIYHTDDLIGLVNPKHDKLINKIHTGYCNRAQEMQMGLTPRDSPRLTGAVNPVGVTGVPVVTTPGGMPVSSLTAATATFHFAETKEMKSHGAGSSSMASLSPRSNCSNSSTVTISDATIRDQLELALVLTCTIGKPGQTVLIFVAGLIDMYELSEKFEIKKETSPETSIFDICKFHTEMTEQDRISAVVDFPAADRVKVIIVGDVNESSVNVPNVDHVICLGSCKTLTMNETYRAFQQVNYFVSQAVAIQRAGKTGRDRPGNVYRLYAKEFFSCLPGDTCGDILRLPITKVLMQVSFMLEGCSPAVVAGGIPEFLSHLPEPPPMSSVETGLDILTRGNVMSSNMQLTKFGLFACELGKDLSLCSLLYDGITLGIGPVAVVIAGSLMLRRSPFKCASSAIYPVPEDYYEIVRLTVSSKAKLDGGFLSEPMMLLSLLIRWRRCKDEVERANLCLKYGLSYSRMDDFDKSVHQLAALVSTIVGTNMGIPHDMSPHITFRVANMVRLISVWSFAENICKMDTILNPPSSNLNCAVIQAQRDITHSLFERLLLGPPEFVKDSPNITWKLVERGKKTYTAIAMERPFKDTLFSFKSVFCNMNAQVGWIECKHLDPEEVVIIAKEELQKTIGDILECHFQTVDTIGVHEGVALFVVVSPNTTSMRRMVDVSFDSFSSISFVTSAATSKQRRTYYHATFNCSNCQPSVAHIRHVFLRSGPYCRPCSSSYARECTTVSPCDIHWKVSSPELVERFSNWFFKTKVLNASTLLVFMDDPPSPFAGNVPPRAQTINDIPIGLRILNSIRSGSQKNQVLHLTDTTRPGISSSSGAVVPTGTKVDVKMKTAEPQWVSFRHDVIQTACGVGILANSSGTPKRVVMPLQSLQQVALHTGPEDLYCVCGTLSILADNTARAAGVTFLPLGQKWLNTALFSLEPGLLKQYALKYGINAAEYSKVIKLRSYVSQGPQTDNVAAVQAIVDELFQEWY